MVLDLVMKALEWIVLLIVIVILLAILVFIRRTWLQKYELKKFWRGLMKRLKK
jgi:hypothetical protein